MKTSDVAIHRFNRVVPTQPQSSYLDYRSDIPKISELT